MRRLLFTTLLAIPISAPNWVSAQDVDPSRLETLKNQAAAEQAREAEIKAKQDKVKQEISSLSKEVRTMSGRLAKLEAQDRKLAENIAELEAQKSLTEATIIDRKASVTNLLSALQRIENNPPPALAASPTDAANASRAGFLMGGLTIQLKDRVTVLNHELQAVNELREKISSEKTALDKNRTAMSKRQAQIQNKVSAKNSLEKTLNADFEAAKTRRLTLAAQAQDLQDLISALERKSREIVPRIKPDPDAVDREPESSSGSLASEPLSLPSGALRFSSAKGRLHTPVVGKLSKRYSTGHPGVSVKARNGTQVWAPAAGRVEFAGPFKNYDQVVILNVDDGYYVLLTGLGKVLVQTDSQVSAGDPVGLMPVNSSFDEKLYIEVRKNGSTVDPTPWFGTKFAKPETG